MTPAMTPGRPSTARSLLPVLLTASVLGAGALAARAVRAGLPVPAATVIAVAVPLLVLFASLLPRRARDEDLDDEWARLEPHWRSEVDVR
ncbi:hypothetical protein [Actinomycetospora termitidis]|uniref:Uncharacterized protein n=1 Tax=Actinomycetospora termitidis TaxID=3053470 RepID=A0ABT7MGH2_9PSEU|nr:hypothetical protein [Actinomycetospora sp. Odt1-22]MDL5158443.1 hypothetical protein [Actinomycetospora sp. Odt1-22]